MARKSDSIIEESKKWLNNFYVNGEWLDDPKPIVIDGKQVTLEVMDFMNSLYRLFLESSLLNDCTIIWLKSNLPNVKTAIEFYNSQLPEIDRINLHTAQSKIQYDKNRLSKWFDSDTIFHVMKDPDKYLGEATYCVDQLLRINMKDAEYNRELKIKIDKNIVFREITESSFEQLKDTLKKYSKTHIEEVEKFRSQELTREMAGYYNYIISAKKLKAIDKKRLAEIRSILGLVDQEKINVEE